MNRIHISLMMITLVVASLIFEGFQTKTDRENSTNDTNFQRAIEFYRQKQFKEAETIFYNLLNEYPANQEIAIWAASNYLELKKNAEALKCIKKILVADPNSLSLRKMLAKINIALKEYDEAEDILEESIELNQYDAAIWQMLSFVNLSQKDFGDAIEAADKAMQLEPKNMNSYLYKGYSLIGRKKFEMAIAVFDEALKIEPENIGIKNGKDYAVKAMKELKGSRKVSQPVQEELYSNVNATHPDGI